MHEPNNLSRARGEEYRLQLALGARWLAMRGAGIVAPGFVPAGPSTMFTVTSRGFSMGDGVLQVPEQAASIDTTGAVATPLGAGLVMPIGSVFDGVATFVATNTGATGGILGDTYRADLFFTIKRASVAGAVFLGGVAPAAANIANNDAGVAACLPEVVIAGPGTTFGLRWTGPAGQTMHGVATLSGQIRDL